MITTKVLFRIAFFLIVIVIARDALLLDIGAEASASSTGFLEHGKHCHERGFHAADASDQSTKIYKILPGSGINIPYGRSIDLHNSTDLYAPCVQQSTTSSEQTSKPPEKNSLAVSGDSVIDFFNRVFIAIYALALTESLKQFVSDKDSTEAFHWDRLPALITFFALITPFY